MAFTASLLRVGDRLDVQDQENKWYHGLVVAKETKLLNSSTHWVYPSEIGAVGDDEDDDEVCFLIHYHGWSSKWDRGIRRHTTAIV